MNKVFIFFILSIFFSVSTFGQVSESFDNIPTNSSSSYLERNWTGDDGFAWQATDARVDQNIDGNAITLRTGNLINNGGSIANGCGTLTFSYKRVFSGNSTLRVFINGTQYGGDITVSSTSESIFSEVVNVAGDIDIQITNSGNRTVIDNLEWTAFSPTAPTVGFDNTARTETETDASFNIDIPVTLANYGGTPVTLSVTASGGTAEAGDFILNTATLTFTADGTQNVSVTINDDVDMANETVEITLDETTLTGITVAPATHILTITDDDIPTTDDVRINELDSSPATDEFVELFGTPLFSLDGLILVYFNGNATNNASYNTIDLTGQSLDANGYFLVGKSTAASPSPDLVTTESIQDGIDAVGLYFAPAGNFPDGTLPTTTNLVDALVYQAGNSDDAALRTALNFTAANDHADAPINESANGNRDGDSVQRGSWFVAPRTPRAANAILPVELVNLTALKSDKTALIQWTTASEINNDYFTIQASTDGKNFKEMGQVKGAGTTDIVQEYHFTDNSPVQGLNYYRLLQVDYDGTATYSKVVIVNFRSNDDEITIFPNPTTDVLTVKFPTFWEGETMITISNNLGQTVKIVDEISETLSVQDLPNSFYFLTISNGNQTVTKRFQKL